MANEQQISKHGSIDTDGLAASGLLIPSATGAIYPGGVALGPDANNDDYAGSLVVPLAPGLVSSSARFLTTGSSVTATLAAGGANTLLYLCGIIANIDAATATAWTLFITATSGVNLPASGGILRPSWGANEGKEYQLILPIPVPGTAANTAMVFTCTKSGGGNFTQNGNVYAWGFYRAV